MPRLPRTFRLQAKNIFLTYPHCPITKEDALAQLQTLELPSNKKFIRVALELHEDGSPHLHALLQLQGKAQITNCRAFDLRQPGGHNTFHPNIQGAKSSSSDVKSYIDKDGDYIDWGQFQIDGRSARQTANDAYASALNLEAFKSKWTPSDFVLPNTINQWLDEVFVRQTEGPPFYSLKDIHRPRSIIIEGPSRTGKTQWARSLGPHNYICGHIDFSPKTFSNDVMYNVIDDVSPKYLQKKYWKVIIGAKSDWTSNCTRRKPVLIKGGKPAIVLCTPGESSSYKSFLEKPSNLFLKDWTSLNAEFATIEAPLYMSSGSTMHRRTDGEGTNTSTEGN